MNVKKQLISICAVLAIVPLVIASAITINMSSEMASEALEASASRQLISVSANKRTQIEHYFKTIEGQVLSLSSSTMIVDAMEEFKAGFNTIAGEKEISRMRAELAQYYTEQYGDEYRRQNNGKSPNELQLLGQLDNKAITLQYLYIQDNPHQMGSKHRLDSADDSSAYSERHKKYHPSIRKYLDLFGYYDVFLVDSDTGNIVYSVYKELDFATSLLDGPYANSGIGRAFRSVYKADNNDAVMMTDYSNYMPSYDAPAAFIASPVISEGKNIGVLIFQMPVDRINEVMTSQENWEQIGLGASGETYLVGDDLTLRSQSRFLIEDKASYLAALQKNGVSQKVLDKIDSKNTSITLQKVESESASRAIAGEQGYHIIDDYRGVPVLSVYTPVTILGVNWGLIAEIDKSEVFLASEELRASLLTVSVIICLVITVAAMAVGIALALVMVRPIVDLSKIMAEVEANNDLSLRSDNQSQDEIGTMASNFNSMLEKFDELIREINVSSLQLAQASEEVTNVSRESSSNVTQQKIETEQVATAMNEMAATVQEVARNAAATAEAATNAKDDSSESMEIVKTASGNIQQLAKDVESAATVIHELELDSDKIGCVLDVIRNIAEQTNLLALNAAIEAARAGEQGRGFAVVADEVRTLASRTQESTQEIQQMIEKLQARAKEAVEVMEQGRSQAQLGARQADEASCSLGSVNEAVTTISDMNILIASAAEEQSSVAEEMNRNITNINDAAEKTSVGSEQITVSSDDLASLAAQLQGLISQFKT